MNKYIWESPRSPDEVISALASSTNKKAYRAGYKTSYQIGDFVFTHDRVWKDSISFRYAHFAFGLNFRREQYWGFYDPPYLVGTITATANGCKILAEKRTARAVFFNTGYAFMILTLFFIGIDSVFFDGAYTNTTMDGKKLLVYFILGVASVCSFVFCHLKYHKLNQHIELINSVAGVECHQYYGNLS